MTRSFTFALLLAFATAGTGSMVAAQTAPAAAASHYTSEETDLGTLLDDPAGKAILVKYLPEIANSEQIDMARSMTLKQMQGFAPDKVTDEVLAKMDADFAKLPLKK